MKKSFLKRWRLPPDAWMTVSQVLVGLFFMSASIYKIQSYLLVADQNIANHFQFWMDNHWPVSIYQSFVVWILSFSKGAVFLEVTTIFCQFVGGLLLAIGRSKRFAGSLLLFIQINIFLGTFHNRGFNEFVGLSLWLALFYTISPRSRKAWFAFTAGLAAILVLFLYNRYLRGDAWITNMESQRLHLQQDISSFTPLWKELSLFVAQGKIGQWFWVLHWWGQILLIALLFTKWRLQAGAILLVLAIGRSLTWMNAITSQGVLTSLVLFVWTTADEYLQRTIKVPRYSGKRWSWKVHVPAFVKW